MPVHARKARATAAVMFRLPLQRRARRAVCLLALLATSACSTQVQQLELKRSQLLRIEQSASALQSIAEAGDLQPENYDLYLMLNRTLFDTLLQEFDGTQVVVEASGRPIEFTLSSVRMNFRPGNPEVTLVASARDQRSGLEAGVDMDTRLLLERPPENPEALYLRLAATRIVPRLSWHAWDFSRAAFVRRILALETTKLTEKLPRFELPVESAFAVGGPAGSQQIQFPTEDGSLTGTVRYPATATSGRLVVKHAVFLRNGVHLFASVEGI